MHKALKLIVALLMSTLVFSSLSLTSWAESPLKLVVSAKTAPIRTAPAPSARIVGRLKEGRRFQSTGEERNGFYKLLTKSGRDLWVAKDQVNKDSYELEEDLVANPAPSEPTPAAPAKDFTRLTYDLNMSAGQANGISYTEANLGLSFFFKPWLAWRNGLFGRLYNEKDIELNTLYGLDTSLRALAGGDLDRGTGIRLFGGPGYRFVNEGKDVPFLEGGVVLRLAGISLGGGVKTLYNSVVDSRLENDTQYFLILSGSGQL